MVFTNLVGVSLSHRQRLRYGVHVNRRGNRRGQSKNTVVLKKANLEVFPSIKSSKRCY